MAFMTGTTTSRYSTKRIVSIDWSISSICVRMSRSRWRPGAKRLVDPTRLISVEVIVGATEILKFLLAFRRTKTLVVLTTSSKYPTVFVANGCKSSSAIESVGSASTRIPAGTSSTSGRIVFRIASRLISTTPSTTSIAMTSPVASGDGVPFFDVVHRDENVLLDEKLQQREECNEENLHPLPGDVEQCGVSRINYELRDLR